MRLADLLQLRNRQVHHRHQGDPGQNDENRESADRPGDEGGPWALGAHAAPIRSTATPQPMLRLMVCAATASTIATPHWKSATYRGCLSRARTRGRGPSARSNVLAGRGRTCCGHQNQRPSIAAMDGVMNARTTSVSNNKPIAIVDPI